MDRIFSRGTLLVFSILLTVVGLSALLRGCFSDVEIKANVFPKEVEVGSPILYRDSTVNAKEVIWEFGNGDFSQDRKGSYIFPVTGNYKVRVKVDGKSHDFVVKVVEKKKTAEKRFVRIIAPSQAYVGEGVVFVADGDASDWNWEFGNAGKISSHEQNLVHYFEEVGEYTVKLTSGNMEYPVFHTITVNPPTPTREITGGGTPEDKFRTYLQNIIDHHGSFDSNYKNCLARLNRNENVPVLINNTNENDFRSYCHGLRILGRQHGTVVNEVAFETGSNGRVSRLLVTQVTSN